MTSRVTPNEKESELHYGLSVDDSNFMDIEGSSLGVGLGFLLGEFIVYNRDLSASEVLDNYNNTEGDY